MDLEPVYLFAEILFTVGGWELGKRIWTAKGADPGRGKWYGAFLGFLLGLIGILTLLGISWRWHPASEPPDQRAGWTRPDRGGLARAALLVLIGVAVVFSGVVTMDFLIDAERYSRWSVAMPDTGSPVTRAACSDVTMDWDACFVLGAATRSDTQWKAEWGRQAQEGFVRAGIGLVVTALSIGLFSYILRRQFATPRAPAPPVADARAPGEATDWPPLPDRFREGHHHSTRT